MASFISFLRKFSFIAAMLVVYRLASILQPRKSPRTRRVGKHRDASLHLLIVLGSGGHTAEMIAMLERAVTEEDPSRRLDWLYYSNRTWIVGSNDAISAQRAKELEELAIRLSTEKHTSKDVSEAHAGTSLIVTVPRARHIHQSLLTAPLSSLRCMMACLMVLLQQGHGERGFPDIILCNGPATATILVLISILLRVFNVGSCQTNGKLRTIYVESWARVKKLSLSGRILLYLSDRFLVQWPQLEQKYGSRAEYHGVLV